MGAVDDEGWSAVCHEGIVGTIELKFLEQDPSKFEFAVDAQESL
jgi:hypothetical protein